MSQKQLFSPFFAKRVNLNQEEMLELIEKVIEAYQLGTLISADGIEVGYEDVNFILVTDKGKFLLKVLIDFTAKQPRSEADSYQYVETMESLRADGVPLPKLFKTGDSYLLKQIVPHNELPIWMIVMEFFEGIDFISGPPTLDDIRYIAKILTIINSSKLVRESMYDPWQPQFFLEEYQANAQYLSPANTKLIEAVAQKFRQIDLSHLPKSIIHADFMRNNILKNSAGEYCVLDYGVVNFAPRLADVGVFLAGFCLDPEISVEKNQVAYQTGLETYLQYLPLTPYELDHIGTMTSAAYALFHIAATHEKFVENNQTEENDYWISLGISGLELTRQLGL